MRIVLALGWYFPESVGGTEVYVAALARRYRAQGHDVSVTAPLAGLGMPRHGERDGTPVFRYPVPVAPTRDEARGDARARGTGHLDRWIQDQRPDVLHVHSLVTGLGLAEIERARPHCRALVVTNHLPDLGYVCARGHLMRWGTEACDGIRRIDLCTACVWHAHGAPRRLARAAAACVPDALSRRALGWPGAPGALLATPALIARRAIREQHLLEVVDRFVLLSEWARSVLIANGAPAERLAVNRLGVSQPPVASRASGRPGARTGTVVGYVGRYGWEKGLDPLVEAIRRVPPDLPLQFVFVGPAAAAAEQAVRRSVEARLAGDSRVRFRPGVEAADVPGVLREIDVLCCPSLWAENGPTIALEARAAGTPVIGSAFGAFPESVLDGVEGRLVPPGDVPALTAALTEVGRDPSIVSRWRAGIRPVRTMDDVAADYLGLYGTLLGEPGATS
ncbi:MAG: glycosyltransferase [Vicinamibacterales bacterium]